MDGKIRSGFEIRMDYFKLIDEAKEHLVERLKKNNNQILVDLDNVTEDEFYETTFTYFGKYGDEIMFFCGLKLEGENITLLGIGTEDCSFDEVKSRKIKEVPNGYYEDRDLIFILNYI